MWSRYAVPIVLVITLGLAGFAQAQNTSSQTTTGAVGVAPQANPAAPVAGANSFTESQARSRIEDKGFSQVTGLTLDRNGIWRGKAMREGKGVDVALDYEGNIVGK